MAHSTMSALSTKLREDEKRIFLETCENIGTSPSNAIRMFVSAFNKRGGFPFDSSQPRYNRETESAIKETQEILNGKKAATEVFPNVEAAIASLKEEFDS